MDLARRWRADATAMLWLVAGAEVAVLVDTRTAGARLNEHVELSGQIFWLAVDLLLVRATARGSRGGWLVLVTLTALPTVQLVLSLTALTGYLAGLLAMSSVELLALTSPAVRRHTRDTERTRRPGHPPAARQGG